MKAFIPTAFSGVLNYLLALTLIASPWLFDLVNISSAALFLPMYIGWLQLIMAIFSNNETGFIKQFPMTIHFVLDVAMGFILLISPWLYTFSSKAFWPELLMGGLLMFLGFFTKKSPFTTTVRHNHLEGIMTSTESNY
jgi:hypothetical protein